MVSSPSWLTSVATRAHQRLLATDPSHPARQYLARRGVTPAEIQTYTLGFFAADFEVQSCTPEFWAWYTRYGYERLVFPMTDPFGAVVGLQVRHLGDKGYEDFTLKPRERYLPCFGLHVALPTMFTSQRVVLVEGVFDYFALVKVAPDTLCTLTANVSRLQKQLIARYCALAIPLFDMDAVGRRGCYRLAGLPVPEEFRQPQDISLRTPPTPPFEVLIPAYSEHDPAILLEKGKLDELRRLVQHRVLHATAPSCV